MYPYHHDESNMQEEVPKSKEAIADMQEYKPFLPGQKPNHKPNQKPFPPFPPGPGPNHNHLPPRPETEHSPLPENVHEKPRHGPPGHIPEKRPYLFAVDPGTIRGCLYRFTYIWMSNGRSFWFYPVYVGRRSVSGYRWSQLGWSYSGMDLGSIQSFSCSV